MIPLGFCLHMRTCKCTHTYPHIRTHTYRCTTHTYTHKIILLSSLLYHSTPSVFSIPLKYTIAIIEEKNEFTFITYYVMNSHNRRTEGIGVRELTSAPLKNNGIIRKDQQCQGSLSSQVPCPWIISLRDISTHA